MLYGKFHFAVKGLCLLSLCEKFLVGMPVAMQEFGGGGDKGLEDLFFFQSFLCSIFLRWNFPMSISCS